MMIIILSYLGQNHCLFNIKIIDLPNNLNILACSCIASFWSRRWGYLLFIIYHKPARNKWIASSSESQQTHSELNSLISVYSNKVRLLSYGFIVFPKRMRYNVHSRLMWEGQIRGLTKNTCGPFGGQGSGPSRGHE